MPRYVAFLRAINVGGHVVKMDRLRALFEEMEFGEVQTFIASGNVIFDLPSEDVNALEEQIERHLAQALGYEVGTHLRTLAEVAAIANHEPFPDSAPIKDGQTLMVILLKDVPDEETQRSVAAVSTETDEFCCHGREVYWLCRINLARSDAGTQMGKVLKMPGTSRNINTLRRLAAKYPFS
jgi:uncharacterized protein (DUF1697 family)